MKSGPEIISGKGVWTEPLSREELDEISRRTARKFAANGVPAAVAEHLPEDAKETKRAEDWANRGQGGATRSKRVGVTDEERDEHEEAVDFLEALPRDEPFEFLVSVRRSLAEFNGLTRGQVVAVLKCKRAREARAKDRGPNGSRPLEAVPSGYYAATDSTGKLRFLHVETSEKPGKWNGTTFIGEHYGGRMNLERRGYIGPDGQARYVSDETAKLLEEIRRDPLAASVRYGRELGVCGVCGRSLTDADSRAAGIGPVCAKKF